MEKRPDTYVWAGWIAKLMAGEANCLWAYWFRANHKYDKLPSDFDLARWTADHAAMVRKKAEELRGDGWTVTVEDENAFTLRGKKCALGGKPDIVGIKNSTAFVWDCKTGKQRRSDLMQVWIYLAFAPVLANYPAPRTGKILYNDGTEVTVRYEGKSDPLMNTFASVIQILTIADAPAKSPSINECRFCDISKRLCPERVDWDKVAAVTDLF